MRTRSGRSWGSGRAPPRRWRRSRRGRRRDAGDELPQPLPHDAVVVADQDSGHGVAFGVGCGAAAGTGRTGAGAGRRSGARTGSTSCRRPGSARRSPPRPRTRARQRLGVGERGAAVDVEHDGVGAVGVATQGGGHRAVVGRGVERHRLHHAVRGRGDGRGEPAGGQRAEDGERQAACLDEAGRQRLQRGEQVLVAARPDLPEQAARPTRRPARRRAPRSGRRADGGVGGQPGDEQLLQDAVVQPVGDLVEVVVEGVGQGGGVEAWEASAGSAVCAACSACSAARARPRNCDGDEVGSGWANHLGGKHGEQARRLALPRDGQVDESAGPRREQGRPRR